METMYGVVGEVPNGGICKWVGVEVLGYSGQNTARDERFAL